MSEINLQEIDKLMTRVEENKTDLKYGVLGFVKPNTKKGEKPTHYAITYDDYSDIEDAVVDMIDFIKEQHQEYLNLKSQANKTIKNNNSYYEGQLEELKEELTQTLTAKKNAEIADLRREYERQIDKLENDVKKALKEQKSAEELNEGLKRIMINRANAMREITPKKQHCGFMVMYEEQIDYRIGNTMKMVYRTTLQTPYSDGLLIKDIEHEIVKDLKNTIYPLLNIKKTLLEEHVTAHEYDEENYVFKFQFKRNFKSHLYELKLYTTRQIEVPEEIDYQTQKEKKRNKKSSETAEQNSDAVEDIDFTEYM